MAQAAAKISAKTWYLLAIGGAVVVTAMGVATTRLSHQMIPLWIANFVAIVWGLACASQAWRRVDEAAREAQKSSWFWGGAFGLLLALIITMMMPLMRDTWHGVFLFIDAHRGGWPLHALTFDCGVLFAAIAQIIGALIGWAAWWAAKR
jgi:hypothetical protein